LDTVVPPGTLDVVSSGGGGGGGGGFGFPTGQDMRQVDVTPGELAVINYLYDIGGESIFAPMRGNEDEEDKSLARINKLGGVPYKQGGQVDAVELILQLLRG